jgi:Mor family transcriptional regulator
MTLSTTSEDSDAPIHLRVMAQPYMGGRGKRTVNVERNAEICKMFESGVNARELAKTFELSLPMIREILRGK